MNPDSSIFVAGHRGLVGSAIVRRLRAAGLRNLVLRDRSELNLTRQAAVEDFFAKARTKLGWQPEISFAQLVEEMVAEDLSIARRDAVVAREGFKTYKYRE